jgi:hypothetical protein
VFKGQLLSIVGSKRANANLETVLNMVIWSIRYLVSIFTRTLARHFMNLVVELILILPIAVSEGKASLKASSFVNGMGVDLACCHCRIFRVTQG